MSGSPTLSQPVPECNQFLCIKFLLSASLVMMKIGVKEEFLRILNLKEPRIINGVEVTTLDANQ